MSYARKTKERWIRPLPKQLINKIAAGEVVERPASVVKELVENSIDAGADLIEIIIEKSGAKLIKIVDNGCGIGKDQIEVAFSRHATSKISEFNDLESLLSYGFRGEALPSIASVSRLRMVSKTAEAEVGTEIIYEGGVLHSKKPIAATNGTVIEIENLFYNTPARRKFLKAESTEARHISRFAMALALGRPDVGISYTLNGKRIFSQPVAETLEQRVASVLGGGKKRFVPVSGEMGPVKVSGFIGHPDSAQRNRNGQFIFINNRYISSSNLSHAFNMGYGELLVRGYFPVGTLLLEVDPAEVDVNAHPAKTEVRLSREKEIHDALYRIIKNALRSDGIIPVITTTTASGSTATAQTSFGHESRQSAPGTGAILPGVNSGGKANREFLDELYRQPQASANDLAAPDEIIDKETGEVLQTEAAGSSGPSSGFRYIGRFSDLYLLIQTGSNLYIVDQHTAHERVLYEEMLVKVEKQSVHGQQLLFPEQVELTAEQLAVFDEAEKTLNKSGFVVSHFGGRMINIEAVPTIMTGKSPEKIFMKIIDDIASLQKSGHDLKKAIAQSMACRSAVMAGDRLGDEQARHLLMRLLECENAYCCPHGRPTFIKLSREDLDRQFGRI